MFGMDIPISEAKGRLTDLVRRAEAGDEIVLTRHGRPAARIVGVKRVSSAPEERRATIDKIIARAREQALPGLPAARSQDFLYDPETGLPA